MENKNTKELISAYLDNEIKSQEELNAFKEEIESDPSLEFDLKSELLTKRIVKKTVKKTTPAKVKRDIVERLSRERVTPVKRNSLVAKIYSQRFITYSTVGIVLLALLLLLINRPDLTSSNISEQTGNNNMLMLARSHFEHFLKGTSKIQFVSDNPEEIKNFFQAQGVKYATLIPKYNNYSLAGAFVSEHNGEKFAHHIYTTKNGKFIYIFQVHEKYFEGDSIIQLSEDLLNYLRNGNKYISRQSNFVTVLKKQDNNVLALVSNSTDEELPDNF